MRVKLAAGNWKMNGLNADLAEVDALIAMHPEPRSEVLICPPATLIAPMAARAAGGPVAVGAQACHPEAAGAQGERAADIRRAGGEPGDMPAAVEIGHGRRSLIRAAGRPLAESRARLTCR
ncbi:MAG: triosephosphate isomerase (TIM) [Rhodobacteraceae bacterium HLUCCO18]|nr:MAG: triosephosphate isomerase (TIM) [Rhodobacteraceae bacterium HLUCCO18]